MTFAENLVSVFQGVLTLSILTWLGYLCYVFAWKRGFEKGFTKRRLKKKFGPNFQFDDEIIKFCTNAIYSGWKYKDVKRFAQVSLRRDEILHTYFLLKEMKGGIKPQNEKGIRGTQSTFAKDFTKLT
jgi:hypothetical protein